MRGLARAAALLMIAITSPVACAPPPSLQTPEGRAAWSGNQVLLHVGELQGAAIAANAVNGTDGKPLLSEATTRRIDQVCRAIAEAVKAHPSGWQHQVAVLYANLKATLKPDEMARFAVIVSSIDIVIATLDQTAVSP